MTSEEIRSLMISYKLPAHHAKILALLVEAPAANNEMVENVSGQNKPARTLVYQLRAELKKSSIYIRNKFMVGYYVTDETKEIIRRDIENNLKFVTLESKVVKELDDIVQGMETRPEYMERSS